MKKLLMITTLVLTALTAMLFAACGGKQPKGQLYTVSEAYEQGFLTYEDVLSIAYYHNGGRTFNEEIMPEDYEPQPKTPEMLEDSTETAIKKSEAYRLKTEVGIEEAKASDVFIIEYDGTYNGCVAVMMKNGLGHSAVAWTDHVAEVEIHYADRKEIQIWREAK